MESDLEASLAVASVLCCPEPMYTAGFRRAVIFLASGLN